MTVISEITALILAGGLGQRLRSVVADRPKPMALINGRPFLEILLESLANHGICKIAISTGYMSDYIEDYFRSVDLNLDIRFSRETQPLGTGGAIKLAAPLLSEPTLLVNGDTFLEADLDALLDLHFTSLAEVTLSLIAVDDARRYGEVKITNNGRIAEFDEKKGNAGVGLINAGYSILRRSFVDSLPEGRYSMEKDVYPFLVQSGKMYGLIQKGIFFDIGLPESYHAFREYSKIAFQS